MIAERGRLVAALVVIGGALIAAAGWGSRSLTDRADFAFCNQAEIASLDPAAITGVPETRIVQALFEGLTRQDPASGEPLPGMARTWVVSDDGLTWRFTLRPDSLWSDGRPVTAGDFAWSFRRLLQPATASPNAYLLWSVTGAERFTAARAHVAAPDQGGSGIDADGLGIEALSDTALVLHLQRPCPSLARILSLAPLCPVQRECLERWGPAWIAPEHIVTNGPFRLVERRVRDRLRLARFDGYWGRADVALRTVDAYAADGGTTQLNMYLTGLVDWMVRPPAGLYDALLSRPDTVRGPQAGLTFLRFNTTRAPFDDPRVRLALTLALDREGLARDVLRGGERGAVSFVPPDMAGHSPLRWPDHDPARARALLAEAGFAVSPPEADDAGDPRGESFPEIELLHPNNQISRDLCEAVAAQWRAALGVRSRLSAQAWKVFLDSQRGLQYDVSWSAWTADYLDPLTFLEIMLADSGNNRTGWKDSRYDELLRAGALAPDGSARDALFREAESRLLLACPLAPLCQRVNLNLVSERVRGFSDNPLDVHPLRDLRVVAPGAP